MITLYYTQEFTGGLLKGIVINEQMRFATVELALGWALTASKVIKKPFANCNPYRVIDYSFKKYWE
mgnify:CR=1 FL=1